MAAGVYILRTTLHGLFEQALGPHQVVAIGGREALVAQPAGVGEFRRHRTAAWHEAAADATRRDENRDAEGENGGTWLDGH